MLTRRLYMVIGIAALLIVSLVIVQLYWIRNTYRLHELDFDSKVRRALKVVVSNTEKKLFSYNLYARSYLEPGQGIFILKKKADRGGLADTLPLFNIFPYPDKPDTCFYSTNVPYFDILTMVDITMRFEYRTGDSIYNIPEHNKGLQALTIKNYKSRLDDSSALQQYLLTVPFDSLLHSALNNEGVTTPYAYGIKRNGAQHFTFVSDTSFIKALQTRARSIALFADRPFITPYVLMLYLKENDHIINSTLNWSLLLSCIIIAGLTIAFIYFVRLILKQKKLSEMKMDFINNMTHEFMTPVTNIALALETLAKNKVAYNDYTIKVLDVIETENVHLGDNINKVLQVAILEQGSFALDRTAIDLHELLRRVTKNFALTLDSKKGHFQFDLSATHFVFVGDETHIINLFYNIIDNAVKYSTANPLTIKIESANVGKKLRIKIEDNGQGMNTEMQKQIFIKFYRGARGNVHDVKGFGLGLTYVKSIADAHGIDIEVKSTQGKGTAFILWFNTR